MPWFAPPPVGIAELLALHGRWRAARPALCDGERTLSWAQFAAATAQVANGLRALGLQPQERVAVLMDNSLEMVLLLFGVVRYGAVAVPLNVSISDASVAAMLEDAQARAVFASARHCSRIDALGAAIACRTRVALRASAPGWLDFDAWLGAQGGDFAASVALDDECNIIYSSGTTGIPKGIVHTHRCRLHWAYDLTVVLRYRSDCVTLLSLGLFSNITWVAMLCTLLVGGTMVVMGHFDAAQAVRLIAQKRVTHGTFVPLQLERLLDVGPQNADVSSLDTLMCCGSPLSLAVKRNFPERFGCRLIELYGLTEGLCTILAPEDFERKMESVGKPFLGTDLRIIGDHDGELGAGQTGEVVGRGPLLMSGYHRNEAASAEATWIDARGDRWLRTGDLGRLDADGFLYIVDRKKDMIISGGQNIYPADIEAVMRAHDEVADVAVIGVRNARWGESPVAVVVPAAGASPATAALLGWTNERVGKQQRIQAIVLRAALPRNANGKVLKRQLREEVNQLLSVPL